MQKSRLLLGKVKRSIAAEGRAQYVLLLALILAGGPLSTQEPHRNHISYDGCIIPLHITLAGSAGPSAEYNFLFQILLSRIHSTCRCRLQFVHRDQLGKAHNGAGSSTRRSILAVSSDALLRDQEVQYLMSGPNGHDTVFLHLGDETLLHTDESLYKGAAVTMRSYYHANMTESSLEYLTGKQLQSAKPRVLWLPLGTAKLVPLPHAIMPETFQQRPLHWSWAGSVRDRPERGTMIKALKESNKAEELLKLGRLVVTPSFAGADCGDEGSLSKWEFSALLHNTKFMPMPSGVSPEQYRIWESIEAGCIPIVLAHRVRNDGILYPLKYLGFKYVELDNWEFLPSLLWELHGKVTAEAHHYQKMSEHNTRLWVRIKSRIAHEVADMACS